MLGLLHHVEINVSNLERSLKFWDWFLLELGYIRNREWSNGRSYTKDRTYIVFVQVEKKYDSPEFNRKRVGLNHLAFYGGTRKQVDWLTEKLMDKKISVLYLDRHPYAGGKDYYAVYFEDPDRIKVEVVAVEV